MAEMMGLIEQERKKLGISAEKFANLVGITSTTYSRQSRQQQRLGLETLQAYAMYARRTRNLPLLRALGAYALGLDPEEITINPSE